MYVHFDKLLFQLLKWLFRCLGSREISRKGRAIFLFNGAAPGIIELNKFM